MSRAYPLPLILLITVALAGCGGGGGGGGGGGSVTGISITPSTLTFTSNHDDPNPPPAQTITITVLGTGTTYIRGENGTVTGLSCTGTSSCTYQVQPVEAPYNFLTPGTTTNGLTFIGCADQFCATGAVANGRQTVTYTYTVTPGLDISPSTALNVAGIEGTPTPPQTLMLTHPSGTVPTWHATFAPTGGAPAFVTLSPATTAGSASSPATLQAQFSALAAGTYTGTIEVEPGLSPRRVRRDVTYTVQSAFQITGNTSIVIDEATPSTALQQTWTASASLGVSGAWIAQETAPWLQLSPTSGDTVAANQIVVSLLPSVVERLPKGLYTADVLFNPSVPAAFSPLTVRVILDMRLPHAAFVMPRAVGEGSTGEAFIRGSGFASLPGTVKFGSTDATPPVTRDSDTVIRANYPATLSASASPYKVDLSIPANQAGLNRERARLTVLSPTALQSSTADIVVPVGKKYAVAFDDARLALYVANVVDALPTSMSTIQRLVWNAGSNSWTLDTLPVALLRDLTLSPGGDELLALMSGTITRIDPGTWTVTDTANIPSVSLAKRSFGVGNDGRLTISESEGGGTQSRLLYYDLADGSSTTEDACCISGNIRASGDGTALYLAGDVNIRRYDVKTRAYTDNNASAGGQVLSVSRTGARFIVDGTTVYRSDFTKLGTLSVGGGEILTAAVITPDGTRAYAYGASGKLYGFQLELPVGTDFTPAPGTPITLPHTVNSPVMTTSADGRVVFIAGDDRVSVRPVAP